MKKILLALLLLSPLASHAMLINTPSAPISFGGFNVTVDVESGANIAANASGSSIGFSGFDHIINISGGELQGGLLFSGFRHVFNITGGVINGDIRGSGFDHIFNFTGSNLVLNGQNITGFLLDGSAIDLNLSGGLVRQQINLINIASAPEPSTFMLLLLGLSGLAIARKKALSA